jgi:hypothetical protein
MVQVEGIEPSRERLRVTLARSFAAMPPVLKWLTAIGLLALVFPVGFTFLGLRAFGRPMTGLAWWSSGAGPVSTVSCLCMAASALLMLRRTRYARTLYLLSWVALNASEPLLASMVGAAYTTWVRDLAWTAAVTTAIALYLGLSSAVGTYFKVPGN